MRHEQDPGTRLRDWDWVGPGEMWERGAGLVLLGGADQEGEAASGSKQGGCGGEDGCEAFYGAQGDRAE